MDLPLLQNNNILTSWNFLNLKTLIQNEQTMEADCKKQAKWYVHANNHIIKAFRCEQTLMGRYNWENN